MFEKYTDRLRKVMKLAAEEVRRLKAEFIGTEHLLLAIIAEGGGAAFKTLKALGVTPAAMREEVERIVKVDGGTHPEAATYPYSPRAKKVIELACGEAARGNSAVVGTEHLLLGLFMEREGIAFQVLSNFGIIERNLRAKLREVLGPEAAHLMHDDATSKTTRTAKIRVLLFGDKGHPSMGLLVVGKTRLELLQVVVVDGIPADRTEQVAAGVAEQLGASTYMIEGLDAIKASPPGYDGGRR